MKPLAAADFQQKYPTTGTYTISGTKNGTLDKLSRNGLLNILIDSLELDTKFFFITLSFDAANKASKIQLLSYFY